MTPWLLSVMTAPGLRADAARNRALLLDTARQVFGTRGLDAPLDDIARGASLGNATLYRRFPTRCSLVAAVFTETLCEIVTDSERALAEPDPWTALTGHLRALCRRRADDRAVADLLTSTVHGAPELETLRARAYAGLATLIQRAREAGVLRDDFRHEDVVLMLMANAGLLERTVDHAPDAWRRHVDYVLDGLRPTPGVAATGPGEAAVRAAMDAAGDRFGCGPAQQPETQRR